MPVRMQIHHASRLPFANESHRRRTVRIMPQLKPHLQDPLRRSRRLLDQVALFHVQRHRLFEIHALAGLERRQRQPHMRIHRRRHHNRIDLVLLLRQHLPEIRVHRRIVSRLFRPRRRRFRALQIQIRDRDNLRSRHLEHRPVQIRTSRPHPDERYPDLIRRTLGQQYGRKPGHYRAT